MKRQLSCIILAAGKGTRMKSATPKALHRICGRPMLDYVLDLAAQLKVTNSAVVLGHGCQQVKKILSPRVNNALQKRLLGTADAVKTGLAKLKIKSNDVLILYADIPLLKKESLDKLIEAHLRNDCAATILTAELKNPAGYGRIRRDRYSAICAIIEDKDGDEFVKQIKEINTGIICFKRDKLAAALKSVRMNSRKKEFYLTDVIGILYKRGELIESVKISDINEALGINSRADLAKANSIMQQRINRKLMLEGVSIIGPDSSFINFGVKIGIDTVIYPFTVIENDVRIGKRCQVGPFAHLREGTRIEDDVVVGNFLELVRSRLSAKTLIKHFGYLGDSRIGENVNIGAGTVVANFDGRKKNVTVVKNNAFIGSDTVLISPVVIGKNSRTGAGAVVTKNVKDGATVVGVPARLLKKRG